MAIVDRIRKLMKLSHSDNVNEAAQAAAMAQKLMLEHKIELADLSLNGTEKQVQEEVVEEGMQGDLGKRGKASQWRTALASVISRNFNCKVWFMPRTDYIAVMGCKSDVQTCQYLQQYFSLEIERLAAQHWARVKAEAKAGGYEMPRPTEWKRSFRFGAIAAIGEKMDGERLKNRIRMGEQGVVTNAAVLDRLKAEIAAEDADVPETNPAALVLVRENEKDQEQRVNRAWDEKFTKNGRSTLRSASWKASRHSQSGYATGKSAGAGISYGGARGGIAGSKSRLEA